MVSTFIIQLTIANDINTYEGHIIKPCQLYMQQCQLPSTDNTDNGVIDPEIFSFSPPTIAQVDAEIRIH